MYSKVKMNMMEIFVSLSLIQQLLRHLLFSHHAMLLNRNTNAEKCMYTQEALISQSEQKDRQANNQEGNRDIIS
jgi:Ni,Fe-hydrogenase III large subunit